MIEIFYGFLQVLQLYLKLRHGLFLFYPLLFIK